ncbi:complex I subunit 1/NuoH family protein [Adhaeribacter pallidiroseus]|uniref:NADH-quinone oxidoreductase subunit H n=1 Tax=Adhaeribacter pallidiroseus TaxID=2072847 RepID=A0A369QEK5_9BACT|nr:complex I subunit 1 family protein [Adhaeribacter pallidiroseus]RDC63351.1 NADH:ubiquinone reductase (H(+)-translocating) [Adhaeribacter pallidiroseus]
MLALLICLVVILSVVIALAYAERKVAAFIQDRLGPTEVGPYGMFQAVIDVVKLLQKEDIVPAAADKILFRLAPVLIFAAVLAGFAVIPVSPDLMASGAEVGIFFLLSIVSLDVIGLLMAGWGSNNKYAVLGAMRSVGQIVSYEIPAGLAILSAVMICQSLNLQEISFQQGILLNQFAGLENERNYLFGLKALQIDVTQVGGITTWNIVRMPFLVVSFIIYYIASLAECNRAPFDIPEAESELVAGFHVEYSGFRFAALFLAEYTMMVLVCLVATILFLGSWNTPLPNLGFLKLATWTTGSPGTIVANLWGFFWLMSKVSILLLSQVWLRWTYPRMRVDQLMQLCWKILIPVSLVMVLLAGVWRLLMV